MVETMQQLIEILLFCVTGTAFVLKQRLPASIKFADTTKEEDLIEALKKGTTLNAKEHVCTVDENNVPTPNGHTRAEMRLNKMWHRATYIVIRHNPSEDDYSEENTFLLVQRRSDIKDYW